MYKGTKNENNEEVFPPEIESQDLVFYQERDFCFAPGFRSVSYNGKHLFDFTRTEASIIGFIHEHRENGILHVFQHQIIQWLGDRKYSTDENILRNESRNTRRLRDFFKRKNKVHPAWGRLLKTTAGRDSKICIDFSWKPNS